MRKVMFSDYGRAVKMAHWIRTHPDATLASTPTGSPPGKAGHYIFNFSDPQFHSGSADGLAVINKTGDVCKKPTPGAVSEDQAQSR
jgi:hypothetical protein